MKLKTKLIPLAGAAAVCATVAPITLTACGSTSVGKTIDLKDGYNPSGVQHKYEVLTVEQTLNDYAEAIDDNKDVFAQDFFWSKARYLEILPEIIMQSSNKEKPKITALQAECKINSLKVETPQKLIATTTALDSDPVTREFSIPTLSFDYEYLFQFKIEVSSMSEVNVYTASGHVTFTSVPFVIRTNRKGMIDAFPTYWCFVPLTQWMLSSAITPEGVTFDKYPKAWSISLDYEMDRAQSLSDEIGDIETVDIFKKQMNCLSTGLRQLSDDDEQIFQMLTRPDASMLTVNSMMQYIGIVGGCAYSWYNQLVGVDSSDAPFWERK